MQKRSCGKKHYPSPEQLFGATPLQWRHAGFRYEGYEHAALRTDWVKDSRWLSVPTFDESKYSLACLGWVMEGVAIEQFTFQGGEETLTERIVVTVANRAH
jgi:hypothetical protein